MIKTGYPSIDKIHLQGIPEEKLHPEILPVSMFATFLQVNEEHLDEPAVETDGKVYTKEMLKNDIIKFSGWLLEKGLKPGDKIMIVTPNSYEGIVATFGANAIGVKVIVVKPITKKELDPFFEEVKIHQPKMILFHDDELVDEAFAKCTKIWLVAKPTHSAAQQDFRNAIESISISLLFP